MQGTSNESNDATDATTTALTSTTGTTTRFSNIYIYGIGIVAALATGVCVRFFFRQQISFHVSNRELAKKKQQPIQPTKATLYALDVMVKKPQK